MGFLSLTSKPQSSSDCLWEWFPGWAPGSWVHMASGVFIDGDSDSSSRASMSGPEAWGLPLGWPSAASSHVGATLCPGRVPPQPLWAPRQGQTETRPPVHWGGPAAGVHRRQGPAGVTSSVLTWPLRLVVITACSATHLPCSVWLDQFKHRKAVALFPCREDMGCVVSPFV